MKIIREIEAKLEIVGAGKLEIEKELGKAEKKVKRWSDKLQEAFKSDTTVRRRSNLRIKLENAAEVRNRLRQTLRIAEEWREKIIQEL